MKKLNETTTNSQFIMQKQWTLCAEAFLTIIKILRTMARITIMIKIIMEVMIIIVNIDEQIKIMLTIITMTIITTIIKILAIITVTIMLAIIEIIKFV